MSSQLAHIQFNADGLVPAILQDAASKQVLMMAWMNEAALRITLETKQATFYSRSRKEIWVKGATSGNLMQVRGISVDCDADVLLLQVEPTGPACHTGNQTCFYTELNMGDLA